MASRRNRQKPLIAIRSALEVGPPCQLAPSGQSPPSTEFSGCLRGFPLNQIGELGRRVAEGRHVLVAPAIPDRFLVAVRRATTNDPLDFQGFD